MKPGQGFVRRVTLDNLSQFARLLIPSAVAEKLDRSESRSAQRAPSDPALRDAEALFAGKGIKVKRALVVLSTCRLGRQLARSVWITWGQTAPVEFRHQTTSLLLWAWKRYTCCVTSQVRMA